MENEPVVDKPTMIQAILDGYGIEITDLEFLLRGFGGDCYRAETRTGTSYFLKLHNCHFDLFFFAASAPRPRTLGDLYLFPITSIHLASLVRRKKISKAGIDVSLE